MEMWFDHTGVDDRGIHRKRALPSKQDTTLSIDLTPMLDVVMIMLIFFIVAGSFVREVAIEVERKPASNQSSSESSENISVQISATDEFWIRGRKVDGRAMRANISRLRAESPKAKVVIRAHNGSTVAGVALVVDAAREAGIYAVSLSTGDDKVN